LIRADRIVKNFPGEPPYASGNGIRKLWTVDYNVSSGKGAGGRGQWSLSLDGLSYRGGRFCGRVSKKGRPNVQTKAISFRRKGGPGDRPDLSPLLIHQHWGGRGQGIGSRG